MSSTYVYRVATELIPEGVDGLEVLVTLYGPEDLAEPPEVALRPSWHDVALRVWGPPLELVSAS